MRRTDVGHSNAKHTRLGLSRELRKGSTPYSPEKRKKVKEQESNGVTNGSSDPCSVNLSPDADGAANIARSGPADRQTCTDRVPEIEEFTRLFTTFLLDTKESLDVLMGLWLDQPPNPSMGLADNLYSVIGTILMEQVDLRIELVIPESDLVANGLMCKNSTESLGINSHCAISGYVHVFRGSRLAIPVVVVQRDCMTCIGALCAFSDESFSTKEEHSMSGRITYSNFRYNETIASGMDRQRLIDRLVDFVLMRSPDRYEFMKSALVSTFNRFTGRGEARVRESYRRLLCGKLRRDLMTNFISTVDDNIPRFSGLPDHTSMTEDIHQNSPL